MYRRNNEVQLRFLGYTTKKKCLLVKKGGNAAKLWFKNRDCDGILWVLRFREAKQLVRLNT